MSIIKRYAEEMRAENPTFYSDLTSEKVEEILQEIIEKEDLQDDEAADEYFEKMWKKLKAVHKMDDHTVSIEYPAEFPDPDNDKEGEFDYDKFMNTNNEYESIYSDSMELDKDNYRRYQDKLLN